VTPQIPLDLSPEPEYSIESFLISDTNRVAFERLQNWPDTGFPVLLLMGPAGVGKTHLGEAWLREGENRLKSEITGDVKPARLFDHNIWLDDVQGARENILFTLINMALNGEIRSLLLSANQPRESWNIELPDLRSRVSNLPVVEINPPDDAILEPFLRKLFDDRGRGINAETIRYILTYCDRSADGLRKLALDLHETAASQKKDLTRTFVSRYLKNNQ